MPKVTFTQDAITVAEAARLKDVSQSAIRAAIKNGRLPIVAGTGKNKIRAMLYLSDVKDCSFRTNQAVSEA